MKSRKIHKIVGLLLVLPMFGWIITGMVFFIKPGYKNAYDQLAIKTYPLEQSFTIPFSNEWKEARLIKSILGHHLLVKTGDGYKHLDPTSYQPKENLTEQEVKNLLNDAFSKNAERYGAVVSSDGYKATTSTGIEVTLNWNNLSIRQSGDDTKFINTLYKIHYLQWTPSKSFNQFFGIMGLLLLMLLTLFGVKIYLSSRR